MTPSPTLPLLRALAFAADKHRFQKRKDTAGTPYINHPIHVALTLAETGGITDENILVAALLHDTIEDTETRPEEIRTLFGEEVLQLVLEVTDDKSLSQQERKRLQVVHAPHKSKGARQIKAADKICNVNDIIHHPPGHWTNERKSAYLDWSEAILEGLKGTNAALEKALREKIAEGRMRFGTTEPVH